MNLTFRTATAEDSDLLADLVVGPPGGEGRRVTAAVFGINNSERLRPLFRRSWRDAENWRQCEVLLADGEPAGAFQSGPSPMKITLGLVLVAIRVLGLRAPRMPARLRILDSVTPRKPDGAYIISEIQVAKEYRDRGLGTKMMARAEEQARAGGYAVMALHTRTNNPARRLYERCGYEAAGEATDSEFERLTGVAGNVLYVKRLGESAPVS